MKHIFRLFVFTATFFLGTGVVYAQTSTGATEGFSASSDASTIYVNQTWGLGTHITESMDFIDSGKTKANHIYLEGHELIATTAGFNIYAGGLGYKPNLTALLKKTNVSTDNISLRVYAALGNGVPTSGGSHVSGLAGLQANYKATSALTWNALQASWVRYGSTNGAAISTGLSFIFGK